MRRLSTILLVIVLAASSTASPVAAQSPTPHPVEGRLRDAAGAPIAGAAVVLNENRGVADFIFGLVFVGLTGGIGCLLGVDPCRLSGSAETVTDASGSFRFTPEQVSHALGRSQGVILTGGDRRTGTVSVKLNPVTGGGLGDLALWDPKPTVVTRSGVLDLRWEAPPGANSRTVVQGYVRDGAVATARGVDLAAFADQGARASEGIDSRALEDHEGVLVLTAGFSRPRAGQDARVDWTAPVMTLSGAGAPPSRGAACAIDGRSGGTCMLTDGDLSTPAGGERCTDVRPPAGCSTSAAIDLGRDTSGAVVAVRPVGSYRVEASTDGASYVGLEAAKAPGAWSASLYALPGTARWIRVASADGGPLAAAEVSVWPATPAKLPAVPPGSTRLPSVPAGSGGGASGSRGVPMAIAFVLVLCLAGALGAVHLRRA